MNGPAQPDPPYGPDPEIRPYQLSIKIQQLETRSETYATREWVWKRAFIALLAGMGILATILGIILRNN